MKVDEYPPICNVPETSRTPFFGFLPFWSCFPRSHSGAGLLGGAQNTTWNELAENAESDTLNHYQQHLATILMFQCRFYGHSRITHLHRQGETMESTQDPGTSRFGCTPLVGDQVWSKPSPPAKTSALKPSLAVAKPFHWFICLLWPHPTKQCKPSAVESLGLFHTDTTWICQVPLTTWV